MISTVESVTAANYYLISKGKKCINTETTEQVEKYIKNQKLMNNMRHLIAYFNKTGDIV